MKISKFIPIALCNFLAIVIFLFAKSANCQEINISPYFGANVHPLGDYEIPFIATGIVEIPVLEGNLLIKQTEDLKGAIATIK